MIFHLTVHGDRSEECEDTKGGNQNLYIEEEQTIQWPKEKSTKGQTTAYKIMYWNFLYLRYKLHIVNIVYHFNCLDDVWLILRYCISRIERLLIKSVRENLEKLEELDIWGGTCVQTIDLHILVF